MNAGFGDHASRSAPVTAIIRDHKFKPLETMSLTGGVNLCCDALLAVFYPQSCEVCGRSVEARSLGVACGSCWQQTRIFNRTDAACWKCGLPSRGNVPANKREQMRCRRCDEESFTIARACGVYEGALRASVLALKHKPFLCGRLAKLLADTQQHYPLNQATRIVPVPLHPERQKTRGFNQASVLAQSLSRVTSIVLDDISLVRTRHVDQNRAGMDGRDRRRTVESAFRVAHPNLINGETVLLIDDVFTTGATVSSCAGVLFEAGAREVYVLTLARPFIY